ncbi:unnamed protein product [Hymenolepis diminuta]|uniref:Immunoglobulin domain-containing protein n=2 Tax=Hymenolepis diminuta TaxID=6216 RepID=A0A564YJ24_HYMDI|nr:unnamed protein product [Hymenolepis diminuta]
MVVSRYYSQSRVVCLHQLMGFCALALLISLYLNLGECGFTVEPVKIVVEVTKDVSFVCSSSSGSEMVWTLPSGERVLPGMFSEDGRFRNVNGSLLIFNVVVADSGDYTCSSCSDESCIGTLKAYIMPAYTLDFSLICGLNVILLILFLVTTILNHLRYRTSGLEKEIGYVIHL